MTPEARLHTLTLWQERMQAAEDAADQLRALTGGSPESPIFAGIYGLMGLCTRQTAELAACSSDWLEAWWLDHQFGARPMQAGLAGQPLRQITTLPDLAALIFDDEATQ